MQLPTISIIIPCYNSEKRLPLCLNSIKSQTYPQDLLEIIVVDDDSTDNTIKIAQEYGCHVERNGKHNIERGKSIGFCKSTGEYVFFIDDDNLLPHNNWLVDLVTAVIEENAVGGQAARFNYSKKDTPANRYAAIFGINDPTVFYLKKRDKLMVTEKTWVLPGEVIRQNEKYFVVKFDKTNLLTIGSQGFLIKKDYLLRTTYEPYLYHMDTNMELVEQGFNTYVMLNDSVIHNHSDTVSHFIKKLKRNISLFHSENEHRKYKYDIKKTTMLKLGLIMSTIFVPLYDSIRGCTKQPDIAWFLHPIICFRVAFMYALVTIKNIKS
ncbi:MAG: glycosyltransferase family 2 protein [Oscillospiraceae bacterium]|jgi:glycosyltransferase involved in cell wall biosynthesis|nr:glycosyltransferase family 2 protein [Oscillospiraceae bacterium]